MHSMDSFSITLFVTVLLTSDHYVSTHNHGVLIALKNKIVQLVQHLASHENFVAEEIYV